jgi:hypothetical protein
LTTETLAIKIPFPQVILFHTKKDPQEQVADQEDSHSLGAKTTVEDLEATQDVVLQVQTERVETLAVATTEIFSVANEVVVKEEVVKEAAREMVLLETTTSKAAEDLKALVVVAEIITTKKMADLVKDTTIKIMTIPAQTEVETSITVVKEDLANKTILMAKITSAAMITEDLSRTEETTTIKTIVQMTNIIDLLGTIDLAHLDSITTTIVLAVDLEASEVGSEEATVEETSEVEIVKEISEVETKEESSEVETAEITSIPLQAELTSEEVNIMISVTKTKAEATLAQVELVQTKIEQC